MPIINAIIDSTLIDSDLTNFPIGIKLDSSDGILSGLGSTDYVGFHFTVGGNECYAEIDIWDMTNETATIWILVPSVLSSVDTTIKIENVGDNNSAYVGLTGSTPAKAVWDANYLAVWHMSQTPGGAGTILDSTSNNRHCTPYNTPALIDSPLGKGLNCGRIGGVTKYVQVAGTNLSALQTAFTIESLHNYRALPSTYYDSVMHIGTGVNGTPLINRRNTDQKLGCAVWGAGSYSATYNAPYLNWGHVIITNTSGSLKLFVNGTPDITASVTISSLAAAPVTLGNDYVIAYYSVSNYTSESRLSSVVRSNAWIKATSQNLLGNLITKEEYVPPVAESPTSIGQITMGNKYANVLGINVLIQGQWRQVKDVFIYNLGKWNEVNHNSE